MDTAERFGCRVRAIRKARKLTISELAERADADAKHLGRVERGEKRPSFELIMSLARALEVSPETFFHSQRPINDRDSLKKQITRLLDDVELAQLQCAHRILKALLEP
jgi:transcriptional regulator with XRE-family HTH domain